MYSRIYDRLQKRESEGLPALVLLLFFILYLILPAGLSTSDGWGYAAEIRHTGQLFSPYHLLYNALGRIFCTILFKTGVNTLMCLKVMNSAFAVLALLAVQLIAREYGRGAGAAVLVSSLAGISFGFMRFATENETYIVPLCLSLFSFYLYIQFSKTGYLRYLFAAGVLASFSVLFHLTYIFFWFAIFIALLKGKRSIHIIIYIAVSFLVPLVYLSVIFHLYGNPDAGNVRDFFLSGFERHIKLELTRQGLLFTIVNLLRSFIQVHGYMFSMVSQNNFLIIPGIVALVFFVLSVFKLPSGFIKPGKQAGVMILLLVLTLLFAMFSEGNAEFMVMIPVLTFMLVAALFINYERFMKRVLAGMVVWNLSYGLIPLHLNSPEVENYLIQKSLEENSLVIATDPLLLQNIFYYKTGKPENEKIFRSPAQVPVLKILENTIDSALEAGTSVYTDCIGERPLSRASITEGDLNDDFFSNYYSVTEISFRTISGEREIRKITGKKSH